MAWFENYAAGLTGTPNITVGTVTASGNIAGQQFVANPTTQPANTNVWGMLQNNTANALDFVSWNAWRFIPGNGSFYPAAVATLSNAGALAIAAGLTATTGSFSGALQVTQTTSTTSPAAGGAGALPATPAGYMALIVNGVSRQFPYY